MIIKSRNVEICVDIISIVITFDRYLFKNSSYALMKFHMDMIIQLSKLEFSKFHMILCQELLSDNETTP